MIIWINGAFGAGKTETSYELHRRTPHSFVFDPENVGFYLRENIPKELSKNDFQHFPLWREFNYSMLKYISSEYKGIIIVPMTVVDPLFFNEIVGNLRKDNVTVHHFTLSASKETLLNRLRGRGDDENSWPAQQIDRCILNLSDETFKRHLKTDNISVATVAETIAEKLNIKLIPDRQTEA